MSTALGSTVGTLLICDDQRSPENTWRRRMDATATTPACRLVDWPLLSHGAETYGLAGSTPTRFEMVNVQIGES